MPTICSRRRIRLRWRGYLATIDQYRTFGSPQGYPGAPMVPGPGTPQALGARDYVASVNLTSVVSKSLVNESRIQPDALRAKRHRGRHAHRPRLSA